MRLYLIRHAVAEPRETWTSDDSSRPLTRKGVRSAQRVASALGRMGLDPGVVITSPYVRCAQTADILAEALRSPGLVDHDDRLEPGFGPRALADVLSGRQGHDEVVLVGHEPDMSDVVAALTGGSRVDFKKGAVARIDLYALDPPAGLLAWLAPPSVLAP